jgi:hypothetical protein
MSEFAIAAPSFRERDGFVTITDSNQYPRLRLPRWEECPTRYIIDKERKVWSRGAGQTKRYIAFNSVEEFIAKRSEWNEEYLKRNGFSVSDVHD